MRHIDSCIFVLALGACVLGGAQRGAWGADAISASSAPPAGVPSPPPRTRPVSDDSLVKDAAAAIDALIDAALVRDKVKRLPRTVDHQFLRRVYLDLAGRIPSRDETLDFLSSSRPDKRSLLIRRLLASEAYVSATFDWWADLLRARTRLQDRYDGQPYIDWIKQQIRSNLPYDRMVSQLICASGAGIARGNGATGYYVADAGMPLDNMANTVRLFLGTRLTCAQCHDHPFDSWTRQDFFRMAAFTAGTEVTVQGDSIEGALKSLAERDHSRGGKGGGGKWGTWRPAIPYSASAIARFVGETLGLGVSAGNPGEIALPADYQYGDAKPGDLVAARTMFHQELPVDATHTARQAYAAWLTSPDNARFTLTAVNRLWKRLMRVGLFEPLDNITERTKPFNPELADRLVRLLKDLRYDTRRFQEAVCLTAAYQAQTLPGEIDRAAFHHQGQPLRRLSAEQLWDSLMTLTVPDVDGIMGDNAEALFRFYEANRGKGPEQLAPLVIAAGEAQDDLVELEKSISAARLELETATGAKHDELALALKAREDKREVLRPKADLLAPYAQSRPPPSPLRRASELPSPMPPGHFLRVFGQSSRQLIDNASDAMNLTQALELMNGLVESTILGNPSSVLSQHLATVHAAGDKVTVLYLAILSRLPTDAEMDYAHQVMALAPNRRGAEYLGWALINSAEFAFNE